MDFFSKYDQIRRKLWIWSQLLKKCLMENFIFCAQLMKTNCLKLRFLRPNRHLFFRIQQ